MIDLRCCALWQRYARFSTLENVYERLRDKLAAMGVKKLSEIQEKVSISYGPMSHIHISEIGYTQSVLSYRVLLITVLFAFTHSEVIFVMPLKTKGLQGAFCPLLIMNMRTTGRKKWTLVVIV